MMRKGVLATMVAALLLGTCAMAEKLPFTVLCYNIENAFDTIHDEGKEDYEFCPQGHYRWTHSRLMKKLNGITKVVAAADEHRPVDLIGLCEVENDTVMHYLTRRTPLASIGYEYIMTNSPDVRGIDVALLYSPFTFHPVDTQFIRANLPEHPTRDILHVAGTISNRDTVDVYVLHLPSKRGGQAALQRSIRVTEQLRSNIDSVAACRRHPNIIVMGDFNADNGEPQLRMLTKGRPYTDRCAKLKPGTYKFRGEWSTLDHLLTNTTTLSHQRTNILELPFLVVEDETHGNKRPHHTYLGPIYKGGVSDHLPVFSRFRIK